VGTLLREDSELLLQAAVLHDIGYAPPVVETGFHALDGARYLRSLGLDPRVVNLVAHHSCAVIEAEERGLTAGLAEFPPESSELVDALIFCDMTVSPDGDRIDVEARIAEVLERYGERSVVGRFMLRAAPELRAASGRMQARLACAPAAGPG
jgi:putative nucleotidyltransferase with HDIG domain